MVRIAVQERFRGAANQTVEVVTGLGNGDCGFPFVVGERYLVYADEDGGLLYTNICYHTKRTEMRKTN